MYYVRELTRKLPGFFVLSQMVKTVFYGTETMLENRLENGMNVKEKTEMLQQNEAPLAKLLAEKERLVIDGSMGTALEQLGCSLNDRLWTARVMAEKPELVKQVHLQYMRAGANLHITNSYQASVRGLTENGFSAEEAERVIRSSVRVCREARGEWWNEVRDQEDRVWPLVCGGVGPYGAYLADGSEYTGNYKDVSEKELRLFHEDRMRFLAEEGADLLLIETQPSLREVLVEAEIAEALGKEFWISFSCRDGRHINEGTPISECMRSLNDRFPHLRMVGVNCTMPVFIESLIREIRANTDLPVAVYPNSGETYDPVTKTWHGGDGSFSFEQYAFRYYQAGARAVGGCCTTTADHISQVAAVSRKMTAGMAAPRTAAP